MAFGETALGEALAALPANRGWAVAFSGGGDSTALLHALYRSRPAAPIRVLHVHHGLHPAADDWAEHCRVEAERLGLPYVCFRVDATAGAREAPEGVAREARYHALQRALSPGEVLLTGHHADDQAETVLLQLMRGAGPRGLAGMPRHRPLGVGWLGRPLLEWGRAELHDWLGAEGLSWIEDPGNKRPEPERNFVRHAILPRMARRRPGVASAMARSARLVAGAAEAERERADGDLARLAFADGGLDVLGLATLHRERALTVLRRAIERQGIAGPNSRRLATILDCVTTAGNDAAPRVVWNGGEARRHRNRIVLLPPLPPPPPRVEWQPGEPVAWSGGEVEATSLSGEGFHLPPGYGPVQLAPARPGERLRLAEGRQRIVELLRQAGVPPWLRPYWPVVHGPEGPLALAGIATAVDALARPGQPGWVVRFRPSIASGGEKFEN
ncbi:MAG: tRNA lysidine(34) synthetase TilS [Pseudomonadota bacterium]